MREAVIARLKWNWYKSRIEDIRSGLKMVPEIYYFPQGEPAQMPEVYFLYLDCKHWQSLWWPGTVADQPHLLWDEFNICRAAENEFEGVVLPPMQEQDMSLIKAEQERLAQRGY